MFSEKGYKLKIGISGAHLRRHAKTTLVRRHYAEALQYLGPFPLFACLLTGRESSLAVLDEAARLARTSESGLREVLTGWAERGDDTRSASTPAPFRSPPGRILACRSCFKGHRYALWHSECPPITAMRPRRPSASWLPDLPPSSRCTEENDDVRRSRTHCLAQEVAEATSLVAHESTTSSTASCSTSPC